MDALLSKTLSFLAPMFLSSQSGIIQFAVHVIIKTFMNLPFFLGYKHLFSSSVHTHLGALYDGADTLTNT